MGPDMDATFQIFVLHPGRDRSVVEPLLDALRAIPGYLRDDIAPRDYADALEDSHPIEGEPPTILIENGFADDLTDDTIAATAEASRSASGLDSDGAIPARRFQPGAGGGDGVGSSRRRGDGGRGCIPSSPRGRRRDPLDASDLGAARRPTGRHVRQLRGSGRIRHPSSACTRRRRSGGSARSSSATTRRTCCVTITTWRAIRDVRAHTESEPRRCGASLRRGLPPNAGATV